MQEPVPWSLWSSGLSCEVLEAGEVHHLQAAKEEVDRVTSRVKMDGISMTEETHAGMGLAHRVYPFTLEGCGGGGSAVSSL